MWARNEGIIYRINVGLWFSGMGWKYYLLTTVIVGEECKCYSIFLQFVPVSNPITSHLKRKHISFWAPFIWKQVILYWTHFYGISYVASANAGNVNKRLKALRYTVQKPVIRIGWYALLKYIWITNRSYYAMNYTCTEYRQS